MNLKFLHAVDLLFMILRRYKVMPDKNMKYAASIEALQKLSQGNL